jgi:hypothetical protein
MEHLVAKKFLLFEGLPNAYTQCTRCEEFQRIDWPKEGKLVEEFSHGSYRYDLAIVKDGAVLAAIEIYNHHAVDIAKAIWLENNVPMWLEFSSECVVNAFDPESPKTLVAMSSDEKHRLCPSCKDLAETLESEEVLAKRVAERRQQLLCCAATNALSRRLALHEQNEALREQIKKANLDHLSLPTLQDLEEQMVLLRTTILVYHDANVPRAIGHIRVPTTEQCVYAGYTYYAIACVDVVHFMQNCGVELRRLVVPHLPKEIRRAVKAIQLTFV